MIDSGQRCTGRVRRTNDQRLLIAMTSRPRFPNVTYALLRLEHRMRRKRLRLRKPSTTTPNRHSELCRRLHEARIAHRAMAAATMQADWRSPRHPPLETCDDRVPRQGPNGAPRRGILMPWFRILAASLLEPQWAAGLNPPDFTRTPPVFCLSLESSAGKSQVF